MLLLILPYMLYSVLANDVSVYSRTYLRSMKRLEDDRLQAHLINKGIAYIEAQVFKAAKIGLLQYTSEPFPGCQYYSSPSDISPNGLDTTACENIVNKIKKLVSDRFPDSKLSYNETDQRYTLYWD
jgi:hypothetical protein